MTDENVRATGLAEAVRRVRMPHLENCHPGRSAKRAEPGPRQALAFPAVLGLRFATPGMTKRVASGLSAHA